LEHFSKDYDHTNPAHALIIPFSKADYAGFKVLYTHAHIRAHTRTRKSGKE